MHLVLQLPYSYTFNGHLIIFQYSHFQLVNSILSENMFIYLCESIYLICITKIQKKVFKIRNYINCYADNDLFAMKLIN